MKGPMNPKLKVGDRVVIFYMNGETSVPPGTLGTVTRISRDPFESYDDSIINVSWDNGSQLALITSTDRWKKVPKDNIDEQAGDPTWNYITQNADIFDNFNWKWLREYLYKIRESGIINMFGASPLLYAGKEHIDRYYGEGREDDEMFQAVLEDADESKNKIIQGVISYMQKNDKDLSDMNQVNRFAKHFSQKIVGLYIALGGYRHGEDLVR